jgi:hypothetical protein
MLLKYKENKIDPSEVTLSLGIRSKHCPIEKIIAGFINLNISDYVNYYQPLKIFRIQRCPNNEGKIEISIKSRIIR